jgi:hypothetical protein
MPATDRFDPLAEPSGNDRSLREGDGWSRREADRRKTRRKTLADRAESREQAKKRRAESNYQRFFAR